MTTRHATQSRLFDILILKFFTFNANFLHPVGGRLWLIQSSIIANATTSKGLNTRLLSLNDGRSVRMARLYMLVTIATLAERLVTHIADVRLLAGMDALMIQYVREDVMDDG